VFELRGARAARITADVSIRRHRSCTWKKRAVTPFERQTRILDLRASVENLRTSLVHPPHAAIDAVVAACDRELARLADAQADTDPAPALADETPATPGTPETRRRSSDKLAAVQLPDPGLDRRIADELAKGRR